MAHRKNTECDLRPDATELQESVGSTVLTFILICMALGALAGLLAGLLGIGGGLVIVPLLTVLLPLYGIVPAEHVMLVAVATSLATIVITCSSSTRAHHRLHNIPWRLAPAVLMGAAAGAVTVGSFAHLVNGQFLQWFFACAVALIGLRMIFSQMASGLRPLPTRPVLALISAFLASIASLLGIGGGALYVPMLNFFSVDMRRAIGLAAVSGLVIAIFAVIGYVSSGWSYYAFADGFVGFVYLPAVAAVVSTSMLAAPLGAKLTQVLPVLRIKRIFGLFLLLVSAKMMFS